MVINHNLSAMFADRLLGIQDKQLNNNIQSLASGLRINKAGDDASGLAVSEKLRSQISQVLIVDAGLGVPSEASTVMEMGYDAVLVNSAIAQAKDPTRMAESNT